MTVIGFLFNDPATTEIYTLSLHDALPISQTLKDAESEIPVLVKHLPEWETARDRAIYAVSLNALQQSVGKQAALRSEEHTSELQSRFDLVCRLLLEKKKRAKAKQCTLLSD